MKYFELQFKITQNNEAAGDVLAALLADAGCETFVPTDEGLTAYIQQANYDETAIGEAVETLASLLPDCTATFVCAESPDENWNATWEAEHHFEPITLPDGQQITIIPRQAFGSGEHATTRMILSLLADSASSEKPEFSESAAPSFPLAGQTVIDAGCGTGVLGIAAMKLGAARVFAYDIDEWSVRNAQENFALNGIEATILDTANAPSSSVCSTAPDPATCLIAEGDTSVLVHAPQAHLLLANINRNILLADLPAFTSKLLPGGRLLLSGFYETDIAPLLQRTLQLGLTHISTHADGDWRALALRNG